MKNEKEQQQKKRKQPSMLFSNKASCRLARFRFDFVFFFPTDKWWVGVVHIFSMEKTKVVAITDGIQFQIIQ